MLDKLDSKPQGQAEEIKTDNNIDLMDFISKSDFSTVNGGKPQAQQPNNNFDFDNFGKE